MRLALVVLAACNAAAAEPPTVAGRWSATVELRHRQFFSTERFIDTALDGAAWLDLAGDGSASGCIGSHYVSVGEIGHYEASDHKDHANRSDTRRLVALRGTWRRTAGGIDVAFDAATFHSCTIANDSFDPQIALHCTVGDTRIKAPLATLVCNAGTNRLFELGIAIGTPPMNGPEPSAPFGSWLIVGRDPGAAIAVALDQRAPAPTIDIAAGAAPLREADYR